MRSTEKRTQQSRSGIRTPRIGSLCSAGNSLVTRVRSGSESWLWNGSIGQKAVECRSPSWLQLLQVPVASIMNARHDTLATTHHSFLGSFSAVSKRNFATKYAFFQVFRDLQNYLGKFSKILQNFAKNQRFSQKSALFLQKSENFAKICNSF